MVVRCSLLLVVCLVLAGCAPEEAPQEAESVPIRFEYAPPPGPNSLDHPQQLRILRGEQELFTFRSRRWIVVMQIFEDRGSYIRMDSKLYGDADYQECLIDLKGDGDARYLIVAEWGGGNDAYNYRGWLVDTKDHFAIVGPIPAGEIHDYDVPNPELIFDFSEEIAYFGVRGYASISFPFKIRTGSAPVLVPPSRRPASLFRFDPARYLKYEDDVGIYRLYCDLAEIGQLRQAAAIAAELGFPKEAIEKDGSACLDRLRRCHFYPILKSLNGDF